MSGSTGKDAAAVKSRMLELTQKFVTRTTFDVAQMREGLARLGSGDPGALELIHQLAHRACGTGGTLGLCALADAAADLERVVEAFPKDAVPGEVERAQLAARLDAIDDELARLGA